jgi:translation initiation factor IF-2
MKPEEIAKKNLVTQEDVFNICKELDIACSKPDQSLKDQDVFLIEKKIETIKTEKKKLAQKKKSDSESDDGKKKIKLKRKLSMNASNHVKSEIKKHTSEDAPKPAPKPQERTEQRSSSAPQGNQQNGGPNSSGNREQRERAPRTGDRNDRPRPQSGERKPFERRNDRDGNTRPNNRDGNTRPNNRDGNSRPPYNRDNNNRPNNRDGNSRPYNRDNNNRPNTNRSGAPGNRDNRSGNQQGGGSRFSNDNRTQQRRPYQGGQHGGPQSRGNAAPAPVENEMAEKPGVSKKRNKEKDKVRDAWKSKKSEKKERESRSYGYQRRSKPQKQPKIKREAVTPDKIEITENVMVSELAKKLNVKSNEVIAKLIKLGVMATINQVLDAETAEILAQEYGTEVTVVSLYEETVIRQDEEDKDEDNVSRPPIVTVMGHVDHGKTRLLDTIRKANVIDGEAGGITQHIGAYKVKVKGQTVAFIDTPGHAAFTTMRARGAKITDIVILVVAANDGVMPQTIEAINHAKEAEVPIIVAINKIDLPEANPAKVRQELASYNLVPEEWGGDTLFAEISAKGNINIDGLLDLVLMQSEMLELTANPKVMAQGTVIEAKLDQGRGAVASLMVQNGTLRVGDSFVVGIYNGKIRAMFDDLGNNVTEAGPSVPVEVLGLDGIPSAGDPFQVVSAEKYAKQIAGKRQELKRIESAKQVKKVTLEDLNDMIKDGEVQEVLIIIKADVDGSVQALKDSLEKLSTSEVRVKVIHAAAGGINESDIVLASASNALIIGYHVRPTPKIADFAEQEKVSIKTYNIIFEVTEDVKNAMEGMLIPEIEEQVTGTLEIKQTFKVSKIGTIAGCIVVKGKISKTDKVRLLRDGIVIYDGELKSLKRFKDDAASVEVGQECGIGLEKFNDIKEGDFVESYKLVEIAKKLGDV